MISAPPSRQDLRAIGPLPVSSGLEQAGLSEHRIHLKLDLAPG